jgi:hypothetical protein
MCVPGSISTLAVGGDQPLTQYQPWHEHHYHEPITAKNRALHDE